MALLRSALAGPRPGSALSQDRVLMGLTALIVGSLGCFGMGFGTLTIQVVVCWVLMAGLHTGLAIMAGSVARVTGTRKTTRRIWGAVSFAGFAYAFGDAAQLVMIAVSPMSREVAQGGLVQSWSVLIGTVGIVVVALTSPTGHSSRRERTRFWLDVGIVMAAATTFGGYTYLPSDTSNAAAWILGLLTGPGVFLVGVFAVVKLMLSAHPPFSRQAGMTLAGAALLEGVAQASGTLMTDVGRLSWLLGVTVIASTLLAGSSRIQQLQVQLDPSILRPRLRRPFSTLPYMAIAATNLLLLWALADIGLNEHVWVVIVGGITSTVLVVGRQLVAITDNTRLLHELDTKVRELNQSLDERDLLTDQLRHQAFHDPLTGLANRAMFNDELRETLSGAGTFNGHLTLMIIDLDDFKQVNDRFGHAAGDDLLVEAAQRLRSCVRELDLVARLGGDEFAVLLKDLRQEDDQIAARIVDAIAVPFAVSGGTALVGASVGVVVADGRSRTAEQLLNDADTAMYVAKRSGKRGYRVATTAS
ncbi:MAG: hypothetical protein QOE58_318 [Actinomycetota bacterium]|nr:hypothetical protein [Actinomycetota bacterium]